MNFPTKLLGTLVMLTATTDLASAQSVRLSARTGAGVAIRIGHAAGHRTHARPTVPSRGAITARYGSRASYARRVWVEGHHETVARRSWVPGEVRREWSPAVYETRIDACGARASVLVRAGNWRWVEQPGHYETRWVEVWVDGYWKIVR